MNSIKKIALIGNPNCGKTSLFNILTKSNYKVGNWAGVTVEKKSGFFSLKSSVAEQSFKSFNSSFQAISPKSQNFGEIVQRIEQSSLEQGSLCKEIQCELIDLPGIYTLSNCTSVVSIDEQIAAKYIHSQEPSLLINIVDASNLERHLYLTLQLLEMGVPVIMALNMMDVLHQQGKKIDIEKLSALLGIPIVAIECRNQKGIEKLKDVMGKHILKLFQADDLKWQGVAPLPLQLNYPKVLEQALTEIQEKITLPLGSTAKRSLALRLLEGDSQLLALLSEDDQQKLQQIEQQSSAKLDEDLDIQIADSRYRFIHDIVKKVEQSTGIKKRKWDERLDNLVLNRFLGIPIFLIIMYSMFFFAINFAGVFQDFFDIASTTIFVDGMAKLLHSLHASNWFIAIFALGLGKGINTTVTFIPVIAGMFFFLSFLEDSGYMARAAFVVDRLMQMLGLPGKAFVPLIVGFGCNVPAIMGARTLENPRDRILTVMMSPFMSCGARLTIFAVFVSAFFPKGGQNIVFLLYLVGILCAMLTGFILRHTILSGASSPLIMELPSYHIPKLRFLVGNTWMRLKGFIFRAGKLILPICILIGALNSITPDGKLIGLTGNEQSLLAHIGQLLTPLFAPMGIKSDNWPATVGLLSGVLAKEVVVATLNTLYSEVGHLTMVKAASFHFWEGMKLALQTIPSNLKSLADAFQNPIVANARDSDLTPGMIGIMATRFDGARGAFAYLLFVLLYIPCVSTAAVTARELGKKWMCFSLFWNTFIAYAVAVIFYQVSAIFFHYKQSLFWVLLLLGIFVVTMISLKVMQFRLLSRYKSVW